jgi:PEP-CTERM/exosortase A-associated glycosyltransferase
MSIAKILDQTIPYVSGYSMRSRYITDSLSKLGLKLEVFSAPQFVYPTRKENYNGVNYFRSVVPGWGVVKNISFVRQFAIIDSIKQELKRNWDDEIALIHAHSPVLNALAGVKVARQRGVPFVYEVRALWEDAAVDQGKTREGSRRYKLTRDLETKVLKKADRITVICQGLKNDIVSRGIQAEKIAVVPNGVDTEAFKPILADGELKRSLGFADCMVIGFVGTFFLFEGLDILIEAAKIVSEKRANVKFLIVGGGLEEDSLKAKVKVLGLSDRITFTGKVKHDDVTRYYSIIDILVYPRISKRITELVTPLKPLEAMAQEKLVIGSDVGGIKELVQDGYNGIIFKAGNPQDLAQKCIYALDNPSKMKEIAKKAREYVVKERNWLNICKRYIKIYNELGAK